MKKVQSVLSLLLCISFAGCDPSLDFAEEEDSLRFEKRDKVTYADWNERGDLLWDRRVKAPVLLAFRTGKEQIVVYGVDAASERLVFAFLANPDIYGRVLDEVRFRTTRELGVSISEHGVPGNLPIGPPIGPGGNDPIPAAVVNLTVETGVVLHKTMNSYIDEHELLRDELDF